MTELSRRSFVMMTTAGLILPESAVATMPKIDDTRALHAILASTTTADEMVDFAFLVEHRAPDGTWSPSAGMLRGTSPMPAAITATANRWHLSSGQRITMLDRNFTVTVDKTRTKRGA